MCEEGVTKQQLEAAIVAKPLPTLQALTNPLSMAPFSVISDPSRMSDEDLRRNGATSADLEYWCLKTKLLINCTWAFCRTRFQKQLAAEIPSSVKEAVWAAKQVIFTARSSERDLLCGIKKKLIQ